MRATNLKRREFLRLSAFAVGATALAGCAVPTTETTEGPGTEVEGPEPEEIGEPAPEEAVELTWWYGWTPDLIVNTLDGVAEAFAEAEPSVSAVNTSQHEWGEALLTAYAAGTAPDIHEHWLPMQFAPRDMLLALDDLVDGSEALDWDSFPEVSWGVGRWDGKHYVVPSLAFFAECALVTNPRTFENAGLTVPDDVPSTWDEMFTLAQEYTTFDDAGNIEVLWISPSRSLRHWPAMYGIEDYDEEENRWLFDQPGWEEVVENIARFYTEFGPEKIDGFYEAYPGWIAVPGSAFASDVLAMVISGYWIPGELAKNAPDKDFYYTWPPTGGAATGKKVTHWGAHSVMIPAQSEHPRQAWMFAEYLSTTEASEMILSGCGWISPLKAFWDVMDVGMYAGLDFFVNELARDAEIEMVNSPSPAIAYAMNSFQEQVVDPVIYGDKDVQTALADFQEAVTEEEERILRR
jgi:ABC-type glycerol-3-phosphate transport system substrate-binding protein